MSNPTSAPQFPQSSQPSISAPKKPFPIALMIIGVVGLLIVLAVAGGIKVFRAVTAGSSEAITAGNSFLDSMGQHNYSSAHAELVPQIQAKTSLTDLKDMETLVEKHHGSYVAHGKTQWNIQTRNGQTSVRLVYPAQFTKSSSTVSMTVVQTERGYQVYSAFYQF